MSESELLFSFLIGIIVLALATIALSLVQRERIDKEIELKKRMWQVRGKSQPTVTVLVYARNQQASIEQMLRTLKTTRYRALDVVVIDDASTDQTSVFVKRFLTRYPQAPIRLLGRRQQTSTQQALWAGYRKSQKGSIVLVMTPDAPIDRFTVKRVVASRGNRAAWRTPLHKTLDTQLKLLAISTHLEDYFWQTTEHVVAYEAAHFRRYTPTITNSSYVGMARGLVGVAVLALLLVGALSVLGVQVLWYGWVIVTAYGLAVIWLRYGESLRDRLVLTLLTPLALFLLPASSMMRGISQLYSRK